MTIEAHGALRNPLLIWAFKAKWHCDYTVAIGRVEKNLLTTLPSLNNGEPKPLRIGLFTWAHIR
jgi:hypothetical protein